MHTAQQIVIPFFFSFSLRRTSLVKIMDSFLLDDIPAKITYEILIVRNKAACLKNKIESNST